jgi:hypothetical protein
MALGLAKDPRSRPSWDEIRAALNLVAARSTVGSPDIGARPIERAGGGVVRRTTAPKYVLGVSIAALVAAGLVVTRGRPEERPTTVPVAQTNAPDSAGPGRTTAAVTAAPPSGGAEPTTLDVRSARFHQGNEPSRGAGDASDIGVTVRLEQDALKVRNVSGATASVQITAVTRAGSRHAATVSRLDPGLQHTIFLDGLKPPIAAATDVLHVEISSLSSPRTVRRYTP